MNKQFFKENLINNKISRLFLRILCNRYFLYQLRAKKKLEDDQDVILQVKAHPLVKEALELFGGELASAQRNQEKEEAR